MTEELFVRVAWLCIRQNEVLGINEVLYVRSPTGSVFFIPGGRVPERISHEQALIQKIKLDLNVDLVPNTLVKCLSFRAPAFGKQEGTMVENHYYRADYQGVLKTPQQIYELEWRSFGHGKDETEADQVALNRLHEDSII
jgi:hypothetical protein